MFIDVLERFHPRCEQEKHDLRTMLHYAHTFDDILLRTNETAHFTVSPWIVSPDRTQVLMVHHNLYNNWSWLGGHADGDPNLLSVALKEAREEAGLRVLRPVSTDIFSIEILPVAAHFKRGRYVVPHLHLNVTYLVEADSRQVLHSKADENSGARWFSPKEAVDASNEPAMQVIYRKLIERMQTH